MFFRKLFIVFLILLWVFAGLLKCEKPELKFRFIEVREGDTFWKLFKDKWKIVSQINKIDKHHLVPGTILRIPLNWELAKQYPFFPEFLEREKEKPQLILVSIKDQYLAGYEFGQIKFWHPISSGIEKGLTPEWVLRNEEIEAKDYPTPRGRYRVLYKDLDHISSIYPKPDGGQPMPFTIVFDWGGYAFHAWGIPKVLMDLFKSLIEMNFGELGSKVEAELEKYCSGSMPGWPASHGCIRLFTEDAQKLFEWATIGAIVVIVDSFKDLE